MQNGWEETSGVLRFGYSLNVSSELVLEAESVVW